MTLSDSSNGDELLEDFKPIESSDGEWTESAELEAEILKGVQGPFRPFTKELLEEIRANTQKIIDKKKQ